MDHKKSITALQKEKARLKRAIRSITVRLSMMERADFQQRKRQEDRRKFLVGLYFHEGFLKKSQEKEMGALMNNWLAEDRDRVIWGLTLFGENQKFSHDPARFENRKRYHLGSYFLEKYRSENRFSELAILLNNYLDHPLDKRLFLP